MKQLFIISTLATGLACSQLAMAAQTTSETTGFRVVLLAAADRDRQVSSGTEGASSKQQDNNKDKQDGAKEAEKKNGEKNPEDDCD